jgi:hypothetical protein
MILSLRIYVLNRNDCAFQRKREGRKLFQDTAAAQSDSVDDYDPLNPSVSKFKRLNSKPTNVENTNAPAQEEALPAPTSANESSETPANEHHGKSIVTTTGESLALCDGEALPEYVR